MQDRERLRIQLTIQRKGESNVVALDTGGPLIHESTARVDETLLRGLAAQVLRLVTPRDLGEREGGRGDFTKSEANVALGRLQSIGEQLFSQLLPKQARELLRDAVPSDLFLHLDEQLINVPWELCHDGADFLATKFRMGRYVRISRPIPLSGTERVQPGLLKVLLIADPTESLPQAAQEAEQLCKLLDGIAKVKVTLIGGRLVSKAELLTELQAHDVVHFAGHSHYDPVHPNQSGWHLHEGMLTAEELRNLSRPPLLVFSNSCQAGATTAWEGRYRYDERAFGIGSAFLVAGVRNYIGTFWVVHDEESRDFAVAFYQSLASGLSLGEALRKTRLEIRDQKGGERLTWASYMLYGDPAVTPFPVTAQPAAPSPPMRIERKLVAILHADVKGYSRLIGEDDVATIRTLDVYRGVMQDLIQKHRGTVVGTPAGDDLLVLFSSTVGAVLCAVEIQQELKRRNAELPAERKIEFRIGINLGEVSGQGENIHGDAINIAARLQHDFAKPGGVCISERVYEEIRNKPELKNEPALRYQNLGKKKLRNIKQPVGVYQVVLEPGLPALVERLRHLFSARWLRLAGAMVAGVPLIALIYLLLFPKEPPPENLPFEPGRFRSFAVLVMPFEVRQPDPKLEEMAEVTQHHFNSQLSKFSSLKVYSEKYLNVMAPDSRNPLDAARKLGIRKMISGIVSIFGDTLTIGAIIVDVSTGELTAEEVEGKPSDFVDLHKRLALQITIRLNVSAPEEKPSETPAPSDASVDMYKLAVEGEGATSEAKPPKGEDPHPQSSPQEEDKHSGVLPWHRWPGVSAAWADEPPQQGVTPEEEVRQVLEQYRRAYEQKDLTMLEKLYANFTPAQREANEKYFQNAQDLRVTIPLPEIDIAVRGNEAAVSYTREDQFIDAKTGKKVRLEVRFTKIFLRTESGWKMAVGKK